MSLTLAGTSTTNQCKLIEGFLKMICWRAKIDCSTGKVMLADGDPPAGGCNPTSGCECLKALIESKKKCTIHLETDPKKKIRIPESPLGPAHNEPLGGKAGGGITVGGRDGFVTPGTPPSQGNPGTPDTPGKGSDADVYIDMTRNNGNGYDHGMDTWLILAHELTSGHAYQLMSGTSPTTKDAAEARAIESENEHRKEHHLPLRPIPKQ